MRINIIAGIIFLVVIFFCASCKDKCYECTRKCYKCNKGNLVYKGCDGDSLYIASSASITGSADTWKAQMVADSFNCVSEDIVENFNICCNSDKKAYVDNNFTCKEK
jgi:hypothetical protein